MSDDRWREVKDNSAEERNQTKHHLAPVGKYATDFTLVPTSGFAMSPADAIHLI